MTTALIDTFLPRRIAILSAVAIAAMATTAHADPVLQNGTFSQLAVNASSQINWQGQQIIGWTSGNSISTQPYNFVFLPGTADTTEAVWNGGVAGLWGAGNGGGANGLTGPPAGGNFLALDGDQAFNSGPGSTAVYTTLTGLTPGHDVSVTFWQAGSQYTTATGATTDTMMVGLGDSIASMTYQAAPSISVANKGFTPWEEETLTFDPDSTSEVLSFFNSGTPSGFPPTILLADVSVADSTMPPTSPVPEPASLTLLATGMIGLGGMVRRRFRKA